MWSYITNNIFSSNYNNIQKDSDINKKEIEEKTSEVANSKIQSSSMLERSKNFIADTFNFVKSELTQMGEEFDSRAYENYGEIEEVDEENSIQETNEESEDEAPQEISDKESEEIIFNDERIEEIENPIEILVEEGKEKIEGVEEIKLESEEEKVPEIEHEGEIDEEKLLENHDHVENRIQNQALSFENILGQIQNINTPENSTQKILSEAIKSLKDLGYHPLIKSKLESDDDGYALETFIHNSESNGSKKICYKIKVTYLIIPDPAKMDEVIPVERYIFTNAEVGTPREKVLYVASWYKDFMIALSKNPTKRLKGYEESKREDLLKQRSFAFNYTPSSEGALNIQTIKATNCESLKDIAMQLNERKKRPYVESVDFRHREHGKAKKLKKAEKHLKNEIIYPYKELALHNARYRIRSNLVEQMQETNTLRHYIEKIQEEAREKQKELDEVRARLVRSSLFGKNKESDSLKQFINYMKTEDSDYIPLYKRDSSCIKDFDYLQDFRENRIDQELSEEDTLRLKKLMREYLIHFKNWDLERIRLSGEKFSLLNVVQLLSSKVLARIEKNEEWVKKNQSIANEHHQVKLDFTRFQKLNQDLHDLNALLEQLSHAANEPIMPERQRIWKNNERLISKIFDKISNSEKSHREEEEEPLGNFNQIVAGDNSPR